MTVARGLLRPISETVMKLKRIVTAALVVASLGISAPSALANHRRVVRERIVVVERRPVRTRLVGPVTVVRQTDRVVRRHVGRGRFIPLPAPAFLPVPPPFYRHNPF